MQLADLDLNKIYSYADYFKWDFTERVELIKGKIFKMSPAPNQIHQVTLLKLTLKLGNFLENKPCQLFVSPFDVRFPRKSKADEDIVTVLQPDLCVVCDNSKLDDRGCNGAPDIVIEILSPGNSSKEMKNKYDIYEEAGVKEYWVVSPAYGHLNIFILQEGKYVTTRPLSTGDILTTPVLPGFSLNVEELFKAK